MIRRHKLTDNQVVTCEMDDQTKRIRRQKKDARRAAG
jgi:hypothetical protein